MKIIKWALVLTSFFVLNAPFAQDKQCYVADTLFQKAGYTYSGGCVNGRAHGSGQIISTNKKHRYKGQFRNGQYHGQGTQSLNNGKDIFSGQFQNGKMTGSCKLKFSDGSRYSGQCRLDKYHGHGKLAYADGDAVYVGNFHNGRRHGKGRLSSPDGGEYYEGTFQNDEMTGHGVIRFRDGETYTGQVLKGKQHGNGKTIRADGITYQGQYRNDKYHGKGTITLANGKRYSGVWTNGKATGGEILKWLNTPQPRARTYAPRPTASGGVIESQIEGEFTGWDGETIFKLTNGQIWQQSSYAYTYHYAYRPEVLIYPSSGGYKMKVEGANGSIFVRQLR